MEIKQKKKIMKNKNNKKSIMMYELYPLSYLNLAIS